MFFFQIYQDEDLSPFHAMPMPNLKILLKKRFPKINGFSILHCAVWVGARKEACLNCLFSDRFLLQKQTVRSTTTTTAAAAAAAAPSSSSQSKFTIGFQLEGNWENEKRSAEDKE